MPFQTSMHSCDMPTSPSSHLVHPAPHVPGKLIALTAAVLLAHIGLLYGNTVSLVSPSLPGEAPSFSTRMIALPSAPASLAPTAPDAVPHAPAPSARRVRPAQAASFTNLPVFASSDLPSQEMAEESVQPFAWSGTQVGPTPAPSLAPDTNSSEASVNSAPPVIPLAASGEPISPTPPALPNPTRPAAIKSAKAFAPPPPARLKYKISGEVKGFPYHVNGELTWKQDGKTYDARMEVSHFLLGSRVQTSRGELGPNGLEPTRFGDKVRSEVAAHFDRAKGRIVFSANTPEVALQANTQDQLSTLLQLAAMLGGAPGSFPEGTLVAFEAVGPRSVESWVFKVGSSENLELPGGEVLAIKLVREAVGEYGTRGELWLAPSMGYLPVRVRLIEANGNFVDQQWSETTKP
jgi:hypothetical protein